MLCEIVREALLIYIYRMEIYSPKNDPEGISLDPKQPPPEPLKETPKPSVVCKYFQQGRCSFGSLCKFSHPGQASPTPLGEGVPTKSPVICKYFQRGNCLFGSRCNYSHLDEPGTLSSADIGGETVIQPPAFSRKDDEDLLMPETEGLPETSAETDTGNADKALIDTPNTDQPRGTSLEADPAISEQQNKGQLYTDYTTKTASLSGKADNNASEDEQLAQMAVRVEQQKRRARAQEEDLALQMVLREEQQRRDHEREEKAVLQLAPKTLEDAEMLLEEQNKKRLIMARQEQDQIGTHGDTREDYLPLMTQECEACLETFDKPELFWCNICETTVCDSCWKLQEVHKHKRPGQSVHVKAGLRPNTGLERSWNTAVSTTGDFSTDGGFEVAQSRR